MEPSPMHAPTDTVTIVCPRCGHDSDERFHGPCTRCRTELRTTLGGEQRDITVEAYQPKMNVTPNAVALKD